MSKDYEFQLTKEQLQAAVKKYGKEYVKDVYRKLLQENMDLVYTSNKASSVKINLGNGNYHYKNLKRDGD